jgi:hypothetical protein
MTKWCIYSNSTRLVVFLCYEMIPLPNIFDYRIGSDMKLKTIQQWKTDTNAAGHVQVHVHVLTFALKMFLGVTVQCTCTWNFCHRGRFECLHVHDCVVDFGAMQKLTFHKHFISCLVMLAVPQTWQRKQRGFFGQNISSLLKKCHPSTPPAESSYRLRPYHLYYTFSVGANSNNVLYADVYLQLSDTNLHCSYVLTCTWTMFTSSWSYCDSSKG